MTFYTENSSWTSAGFKLEQKGVQTYRWTTTSATIQYGIIQTALLFALGHCYCIFIIFSLCTGQLPFRQDLVFYKPHSHPNGFYWGHQCSLTHTLANSINVSNMQSSDDCNRKEPGLKPDCLQFEIGVIWVSFAKCKQRL